MQLLKYFPLGFHARKCSEIRFDVYTHIFVPALERGARINREKFKSINGIVWHWKICSWRVKFNCNYGVGFYSERFYDLHAILAEKSSCTGDGRKYS